MAGAFEEKEAPLNKAGLQHTKEELIAFLIKAHETPKPLSKFYDELVLKKNPFGKFANAYENQVDKIISVLNETVGANNNGQPLEQFKAELLQAIERLLNL